MKIERVILTNYRGYSQSTIIDFNDLTVFVGRNDAGKSTVLEALDLFFNDGKGVIKFDKTDINVSCGVNEYEITVIFSELPDKVVVDSTYETTLLEEYLLNADGYLEVKKKFNGSRCTSVIIRAKHPVNSNCSNLHLKKKSELRRIINDNGISCGNQNINSVMRKAIWSNCGDDLQLELTDIEVNSGEDTKRIWEKLSTALPVYSLFQSDRQNSDSDKEIQDPLKLAVAQFINDAEIQRILKSVAEQVEEKLREVSNRTLDKLREMDPAIADSLNPVIPSAEKLKWAEVFTKNVSITGDEDISINKRGSGVKRLILLNFFRAEAERRQVEGDETGIIYAIEEPETSQHFANQKILAEALITLSHLPNTQVIMTTHSGVIVKKLKYEDLRLVSEDREGVKNVISVQKGLLVYPSMNEVNYTAFGEVTEEYHDELYGYIEREGWLSEYENGKTQRPYIRVQRNGNLKNESRTLTHYIRDVLHHPENQNNARYTDQELAQSVSEMRDFIEMKRLSE